MVPVPVRSRVARRFLEAPGPSDVPDGMVRVLFGPKASPVGIHSHSGGVHARQLFVPGSADRGERRL